MSLRVGGGGMLEVKVGRVRAGVGQSTSAAVEFIKSFNNSRGEGSLQ